MIRGQKNAGVILNYKPDQLVTCKQEEKSINCHKFAIFTNNLQKFKPQGTIFHSGINKNGNQCTSSFAGGNQYDIYSSNKIWR